MHRGHVTVGDPTASTREQNSQGVRDCLCRNESDIAVSTRCAGSLSLYPADVTAVGYVRLYTDDTGTSRFEDLEVTFTPGVFSPPAPPSEVSEPIQASVVMFLHTPTGWEDLRHPAPARQLAIVVRGVLELVAGGETRSFKAGDMVLTEDTSGEGHGARVLEDVVLAVVRL